MDTQSTATTPTSALRYNVIASLTKNGRRYYLQVRGKVLRKFGISPNTWDLWCNKTQDSTIYGDFPVSILLYLSKEIGVPMESLINTPKEKSEISL